MALHGREEHIYSIYHINWVDMSKCQGPTAGNLPRGLDGDLLKKEVMKQASKHLEVYLDWR